MSQAFLAWANGPTGLKTVHAWGPIANWGIVLAALADMNKPAEQISPNMTGVMIVYSALFMRFAWMVRPRNYLLLACHATNEAAQIVQMGRWLSSAKPAAEGAPAAAAAAAAPAPAATAKLH